VTDDKADRHVHEVIESLRELAAAQSELGRAFARSMRMHGTDAVAIVEIINAEGRGLPLTPARLAERIGLTTGATSILLNRLEKAGHVVRTREHSDRRVVTLRSTPGIHAAATEFYEPLSRLLGTVLGDYSAADLERTDSVVSRLRSTMHTYMSELDPPDRSPAS
jgi:MarR family transcriptional regulator, organic hydroperoxide resistance regulator